MRIVVEVRRGVTYEAIRQRLEGSEASGLMKEIGKLMKNRARKAFKMQGRGQSSADKWKPRRVPNIIGALMDFAKGGRKPLKRRFDSRPAAVDTNILRRSIDFRVVKDNEVEIGTTVPYASKVQFGGEGVFEMTAPVRTKLARWLRTPTGKQWRPHFGFLFRRDHYFVDTPPRPFLEYRPEDRDDIIRRVARHLTRPFDPPEPEDGGN